MNNTQTISQLRQETARRLESEVESIAVDLFQGRVSIRDAFTSRLTYEVLNVVSSVESATPSETTAERVVLAWVTARHLLEQIAENKFIDSASRRKFTALLIFGIDRFESNLFLIGPTPVRPEAIVSDQGRLLSLLVRHFELSEDDARTLANVIVLENEATAEAV